MSESFVPFRPAPATPASGPARFKARVLAQAEARPFVPASAASPEPVSHACASEPRVTLRREGDRITHIEIHCACGRHLELECSY